MNLARGEHEEPEGVESRGFPLSLGQVIALIAGLLLVIFIAQNTDEHEVQFLLFDWTTPLWLAFLVAAAIGFLVGWAYRGRRDKRAA